MKRDPRNLVQHLERYIFALPHCREKIVLDLGSKDGYGSHIISHTAKEITLSDCSGKCLYQAKSYYHFLCSAKFDEVDFNKTFPDGKWDTILAFEVIEHVDNPYNFVKEIARHLKVNGKLVFSVPHMKPAKVHKTLFNEKSIKDLISKYLSIDEFYVQDSYGISNRPTNNNCYVGVATKV